MHATSPEREETARLLARVLEKSGAFGVACGWTDDFAPGWMVPVHAVALARCGRWELDAPRTFAVGIEEHDGLSWHLAVRGTNEAGLERAWSAVDQAVGWLNGRAGRDRPSIPEQPSEGAEGRLVRLLDAYRLVGFETGTSSHARFLRGELDRSAEGCGATVVGPARAVARAFGDLARLASALLGLGNVLEARGALAAAAGVYVIGYELALLRSDWRMGIDAARFAGRAYRKLTDWERAAQWYGAGRRIAEHEDDLVSIARVLDGLGNTYRDRGAYPRARECYQKAWETAQSAGDPVEMGNVALGLMNVERKAGRLDVAAELGWEAIRIQTKPSEQVNLLIDIGTLLLEGGDIDAAEHAYRGAQRSAAADPDMSLLAQDAQAYCSALRGDAALYEKLRPRAPKAAPSVRVQIGYFRAVALDALGDARADRVLRAVERYARKHGLSEWEVKASLRDGRQPLPPTIRAVRTPDEVRQGLRELSTVPS